MRTATAETIIQAQDATSVAAADVSTLEFTLNFLYAMRFELVFLAGVIALWATGVLSKNSGKNKNVSGTRQSRSQGVTQHQRRGTPSRTSQQDLAESTANVGNRDPAWLCEKMQQYSSSGQPLQALELFEAALATSLGPRLTEAHNEQQEKTILALLLSLIRTGSRTQAMRLVRHVHSLGLKMSNESLTSIVKLFVAHQCFDESLTMYDLLAANFEAVGDKSAWSCLLFSAVETRRYKRCEFLFTKIKSCGGPSQKDYWNMIRHGSSISDWRMLVTLLQEMRKLSMEIDTVMFNTALSACVSADRVDQARKLLEDIEYDGGLSDQITYNTLMKGYSKQGQLEKCFEVFELMRKRGLPPSQVTYGILLDACISSNETDRAAKLFDQMTSEGHSMNTVLYTTLIKGFARDGKVAEAMRAYHKMCESQTAFPDIITYSILLKSHCDAGLLEDALALLETMVKKGVRPDEVIFNNLLAGCAKANLAELAQKLYGEMVNFGIKPTNATFSILIRLYAQSNLLDLACEMLRTEPSKHNIELESRLFVQLIQSCIRARHGRRALEMYELLYQHALPSPAVHSSILGMCSKLNMYDTAAEMLEVATKKGGRVDANDANQLLDGALKKKKAAVVQSCVASMKALRLDVSPALASKI